MFEFPRAPELPSAQTAEAELSMRYEDVAQDGRLVLDAIPHALGDVVWRRLLAHHPLTQTELARGVVPILSRLVIETLEGPVGVRATLEGRGCFALGHTRDAAGAVDRLLLNTWADVYGPRSRTHGAPPPGAGARIHLGRVFAEHVFTRPFGAMSARKVLAFEGVDEPVPARTWVWRAPHEVSAVPEGAERLENELAADASRVVFGVAHTDSNQHVNSLVYPRLFEEAALRRFAALGHSTARLLAQRAEIAFRKPSFAGDAVRVHLQALRVGGELAAVGVLLEDDASGASVASGAKPRCTFALLFGAGPLAESHV